MHAPHVRTTGWARSPLLSQHQNQRVSSPFLGVGYEARGLCSGGWDVRSAAAIGDIAMGILVQNVLKTSWATDRALTAAKTARHTYEAACPQDEKATIQDEHVRTAALSDAAGKGRGPAMTPTPQFAECPPSGRPGAQLSLPQTRSPGRLSEAECRHVPCHMRVTPLSSRGAV